jgi:NADP-dependent alcohol dehydrogenase
MKAVEIIRAEKIGFILAVGGGSVIDGVKFISAAVNFEGDEADILKKRILFKDVSKVIPFGTVLTLPATGSEMNSGAVVTIEATQEKLTLGGSVIDGVKFISAAVNFEGDEADILKKRILFKDVSKVIPFGTVLTLPATGSEMNSGAVVTIEATQEKLTLGGSALFPVFSIVDPTVIISLPKRQLQNGVVDAFTHVMEQYLTYTHDALLQDRISESILQTLIEIGPAVVENPSDYKLASNFVWSATMALNGLIQKGVPSDWATHMIGHELTALYEIDHARTLAIIGPNLYRVMFDTKKDKLAQYGKRVWKIQGNSTEEIAEKAIEKTVEFFHKMGMKTKISENADNIEKTADFIVNRFEERGWKAMGEKQNITLEKVRAIVEMSY